MSLYIDGKKISNMYHNGRAINGVYRDGVKLWGKESSETIKGLRLEAMSDLDRIYLSYALSEITDGQIESWVDVSVGSKTFRLAGDMTSRNKGLFVADTLTWGSVKVTSDDIWAGGYITVKIKVAPIERRASSEAWETNNKGTVSFGSTSLAPETGFKVTLYNSLKKMLGDRGIKGKLNVTMLVDNEEVDSFVNKSTTISSKERYTYSWQVSEDIHNMFTEPQSIKFNIALTSVSVIGVGVTGNTINLRKLLGEAGCGLFMETGSIERTIQLKVKEIVK
jgi:hypothetical protein